MTLREDAAKALYDYDGRIMPITVQRPPFDAPGRVRDEYLAAADAVLSVVRDRLLSDQAVNVGAKRLASMAGAHPENFRGASARLLEAAWAAIETAGEPTT